jgi:hypothetical protein
MKSLLTLSALLEFAVGALLLLSPSRPVSLLLGTPLDARSGVVIGRLAGAALVSLGVACWLARNEGQRRAARGVALAMLLYNFGAAAVLAHASLRVELTACAIWPAAVLHLALGVWCAAAIRASRCLVT